MIGLKLWVRISQGTRLFLLPINFYYQLAPNFESYKVNKTRQGSTLARHRRLQLIEICGQGQHREKYLIGVGLSESRQTKLTNGGAT